MPALLFNILYALLHLFMVLPEAAHRAPCPDRERPHKRAYILISKQIGDIFRPHVGAANIIFCQQFPCMVQLFLEICVFLLQFPL